MFADDPNLDLEGKVLLEILDDHDKERQLDAERLGRIRRACDEGRAVGGKEILEQ